MVHGNPLAKRVFVLDLLVFLRHILLGLLTDLGDVILILDEMLLHVLFHLFLDLLLMFFDDSMILINGVLAFLDRFCNLLFRLLNASLGTQ